VPSGLIVGTVAAALVALAALRANALSPGGAIAAVIIGLCAVAPGWTWGALLVVFFTTSVALTRTGQSVKLAKAGGVAGTADARTSAQVLANGAVFASATLALAMVGGESSGGSTGTVLAAAALGALGAATADTWATEVGLLSGAQPRSLATGRPVPPGMSGGVTVAGTAAGAAGAALFATGAWLFGMSVPVVAAGFAGGITGMLADSMLGALVQSRRWCDACSTPTERTMHTCGTATRHAGGWRWLGNNGVNALATTAGAASAAAVLGLFADGLLRAHPIVP
jgi:uncharacterized protein (TIGR00297 family)